MKLTNFGAANQPIIAPTKIASSELMMRLRSSTRCSKNVICPPVSGSGVTAEDELVSSWLSVVMGGQFAGLCGTRRRKIRVRGRRSEEHTSELQSRFGI